jgi:hypothetical protein
MLRIREVCNNGIGLNSDAAPFGDGQFLVSEVPSLLMVRPFWSECVRRRQIAIMEETRLKPRVPAA